MKKVMFFWTNRAEEGPLRPVIRRLDEDPDILCVAAPWYKDIAPSDLGKWYKKVFKTMSIAKPDLIFASFDRVEMLPVAIAAMVQNIPVAQIHAGNLAGPGTWDDKVRFAISSIAELLFCNGWASWDRAVKMRRPQLDFTDPLFEILSREQRQDLAEQIDVFEVGSTALDDVEIDDFGLVPRRPSAPGHGDDRVIPYDLVLYNPPTAHPEEITQDMAEIFQLIKGKWVWWIGPNGDPGSDLIENLFWEHMKSIPLQGPKEHITYSKKLPREQFLGLMQNCERFIGNSSSMFKESPAFLKEEQIVNIGTRNKDRSFINVHVGGSDRIHKHVRRFLGLE